LLNSHRSIVTPVPSAGSPPRTHSARALRQAKRLAQAAILALAALAASGLAHADSRQDVWRTAVIEKPGNGQRVLVRYLDQFRQPVERAAFPYAVVLSWRYASDTGLPDRDETDAMYELEDRLGSELDGPGRGMLVLASTGENMRMWTYYARSELDFRAALQAARVPASRFPVQVTAHYDPAWTEYERFKGGMPR